VPCDDEFLMSG